MPRREEKTVERGESGFGIQFETIFVVVEVMPTWKGQPSMAVRYGFQVGDVILKVNNVSTRNMTLLQLRTLF